MTTFRINHWEVERVRVKFTPFPVWLVHKDLIVQPPRPPLRFQSIHGEIEIDFCFPHRTFCVSSPRYKLRYTLTVSTNTKKNRWKTIPLAFNLCKQKSFQMDK